MPDANDYLAKLIDGHDYIALVVIGLALAGLIYTAPGPEDASAHADVDAARQVQIAQDRYGPPEDTVFDHDTVTVHFVTDTVVVDSMVGVMLDHERNKRYAATRQLDSLERALEDCRMGRAKLEVER